MSMDTETAEFLSVTEYLNPFWPASNTGYLYDPLVMDWRDGGTEYLMSFERTVALPKIYLQRLESFMSGSIALISPAAWRSSQAPPKAASDEVAYNCSPASEIVFSLPSPLRQYGICTRIPNEVGKYFEVSFTYLIKSQDHALQTVLRLCRDHDPLSLVSAYDMKSVKSITDNPLFSSYKVFLDQTIASTNQILRLYPFYVEANLSMATNLIGVSAINVKTVAQSNLLVYANSSNTNLLETLLNVLRTAVFYGATFFKCYCPVNECCFADGTTQFVPPSLSSSVQRYSLLRSWITARVYYINVLRQLHCHDQALAECRDLMRLLHAADSDPRPEHAAGPPALQVGSAAFLPNISSFGSLNCNTPAGFAPLRRPAHSQLEAVKRACALDDPDEDTAGCSKNFYTEACDRKMDFAEGQQGSPDSPGPALVDIKSVYILCLLASRCTDELLEYLESGDASRALAAHERPLGRPSTSGLAAGRPDDPAAPATFMFDSAENLACSDPFILDACALSEARARSADAEQGPSEHGSLADTIPKNVLQIRAAECIARQRHIRGEWRVSAVSSPARLSADDLLFKYDSHYYGRVLTRSGMLPLAPRGLCASGASCAAEGRLAGPPGPSGAAKPSKPCASGEADEPPFDPWEVGSDAASPCAGEGFTTRQALVQVLRALTDGEQASANILLEFSKGTLPGPLSRYLFYGPYIYLTSTLCSGPAPGPGAGSRQGTEASLSELAFEVALQQESFFHKSAHVYGRNAAARLAHGSVFIDFSKATAVPQPRSSKDFVAAISQEFMQTGISVSTETRQRRVIATRRRLITPLTTVTAMYTYLLLVLNRRARWANAVARKHLAQQRLGYACACTPHDLPPIDAVADIADYASGACGHSALLSVLSDSLLYRASALPAARFLYQLFLLNPFVVEYLLGKSRLPDVFTQRAVPYLFADASDQVLPQGMGKYVHGADGWPRVSKSTHAHQQRLEAVVYVSEFGHYWGGDEVFLSIYALATKLAVYDGVFAGVPFTYHVRALQHLYAAGGAVLKYAALDFLVHAFADFLHYEVRRSIVVAVQSHAALESLNATIAGGRTQLERALDARSQALGGEPLGMSLWELSRQESSENFDCSYLLTNIRTYASLRAAFYLHIYDTMLSPGSPSLYSVAILPRVIGLALQLCPTVSPQIFVYSYRQLFRDGHSLSSAAAAQSNRKNAEIAALIQVLDTEFLSQNRAYQHVKLYNAQRAERLSARARAEDAVPGAPGAPGAKGAQAGAAPTPQASAAKRAPGGSKGGQRGGKKDRAKAKSRNGRTAAAEASPGAPDKASSALAADISGATLLTRLIESMFPKSGGDGAAVAQTTLRISSAEDALFIMFERNPGLAMLYIVSEIYRVAGQTGLAAEKGTKNIPGLIEKSSPGGPGSVSSSLASRLYGLSQGNPLSSLGSPLGTGITARDLFNASEFHDKLSARASAQARLSSQCAAQDNSCHFGCLLDHLLCFTDYSISEVVAQYLLASPTGATAVPCGVDMFADTTVSCCNMSGYHYPAINTCGHSPMHLIAACNLSDFYLLLMSKLSTARAYKAAVARGVYYRRDEFCGFLLRNNYDTDYRHLADVLPRDRCARVHAHAHTHVRDPDFNADSDWGYNANVYKAFYMDAPQGVAGAMAAARLANIRKSKLRERIQLEPQYVGDVPTYDISNLTEAELSARIRLAPMSDTDTVVRDGSVVPVTSASCAYDEADAAGLAAAGAPALEDPRAGPPDAVPVGTPAGAPATATTTGPVPDAVSAQALGPPRVLDKDAPRLTDYFSTSNSMKSLFSIYSIVEESDRAIRDISIKINATVSPAWVSAPDSLLEVEDALSLLLSRTKLAAGAGTGARRTYDTPLLVGTRYNQTGIVYLLLLSVEHSVSDLLDCAFLSCRNLSASILRLLLQSLPPDFEADRSCITEALPHTQAGCLARSADLTDAVVAFVQRAASVSSGSSAGGPSADGPTAGGPLGDRAPLPETEIAEAVNLHRLVESTRAYLSANVLLSAATPSPHPFWHNYRGDQIMCDSRLFTDAILPAMDELRTMCSNSPRYAFRLYNAIFQSQVPLCTFSHGKLACAACAERRASLSGSVISSTTKTSKDDCCLARNKPKDTLMALVDAGVSFVATYHGSFIPRRFVDPLRHLFAPSRNAFLPQSTPLIQAAMYASDGCAVLSRYMTANYSKAFEEYINHQDCFGLTALHHSIIVFIRAAQALLRFSSETLSGLAGGDPSGAAAGPSQGAKGYGKTHKPVAAKTRPTNTRSLSFWKYLIQSARSNACALLMAGASPTVQDKGAISATDRLAAFLVHSRLIDGPGVSRCFSDTTTIIRNNNTTGIGVQRRIYPDVLLALLVNNDDSVLGHVKARCTGSSSKLSQQALRKVAGPYLLNLPGTAASLEARASTLDAAVYIVNEIVESHRAGQKDKNSNMAVVYTPKDCVVHMSLKLTNGQNQEFSIKPNSVGTPDGGGSALASALLAGSGTNAADPERLVYEYISFVMEETIHILRILLGEYEVTALPNHSNAMLRNTTQRRIVRRRSIYGDRSDAAGGGSGLSLTLDRAASAIDATAETAPSVPTVADEQETPAAPVSIQINSYLQRGVIFSKRSVLLKEVMPAMAPPYPNAVGKKESEGARCDPRDVFGLTFETGYAESVPAPCNAELLELIGAVSSTCNLPPEIYGFLRFGQPAQLVQPATEPQKEAGASEALPADVERCPSAEEDLNISFGVATESSCSDESDISGIYDPLYPSMDYYCDSSSPPAQAPRKRDGLLFRSRMSHSTLDCTYDTRVCNRFWRSGRVAALATAPRTSPHTWSLAPAIDDLEGGSDAQRNIPLFSEMHNSRRDDLCALAHSILAPVSISLYMAFSVGQSDEDAFSRRQSGNFARLPLPTHRRLWKSFADDELYFWRRVFIFASNMITIVSGRCVPTSLISVGPAILDPFPAYSLYRCIHVRPKHWLALPEAGTSQHTSHTAGLAVVGPSGTALSFSTTLSRGPQELRQRVLRATAEVGDPQRITAYVQKKQDIASDLRSKITKVDVVQPFMRMDACFPFSEGYGMIPLVRGTKQ